MKKYVPRKFTKLTGKHLCQSLFFSKAAGLRPATFLKKSLAQAFSCEFCEISKNRTPFLQTTSGQMLLTPRKWFADIFQKRCS